MFLRTSTAYSCGGPTFPSPKMWCLAYIIPVVCGAGLQLHRHPEEKLYTIAGIRSNNADESSEHCICMNPVNDIVRIVPRQSQEVTEKLKKTEVCDNPTTTCNYMCESGGDGSLFTTSGRVVRWRLGKVWPFFVFDHKGPRNSTHPTDPFTVTHVSHGIIAFVLWTNVLFPLVLKFREDFSIQLWWRLGALVVAILEAVWELSENSPAIIVQFRAGGISRDYYGDSVLNSFFDWLVAPLAFFVCMWLCRSHGRNQNKINDVVKYGCLLVLVSEIVLVLYQRDCWLLILIQLLANPQWLIDFQASESFADVWLESAKS